MWYASFIPGWMYSSGNNKNIKKLNEFENKIEYQNTFMQLLNLTLDTYTWRNLPDTCNARFLESQLVLGGWACMRQGDNGLQTLGFLPKQWNVYGEPTSGTAYGFFGSAMNCNVYTEGSVNDFADTVFVRCNQTNYAMINYIRIFTTRLSDLMRSMDVVQRQIKAPYVISCEESQKATVEKILNDTQENKIAIVASDRLNPDTFKILNTNVKSENLVVLRDHYVEIMNMFLTLIGVSNISNSTKKERMIVAEASSNEDIINDYLNQGLVQRKLFAEQCNEFFGTNISVEINETRSYKKEENETQEVEDNEEV